MRQSVKFSGLLLTCSLLVLAVCTAAIPNAEANVVMSEEQPLDAYKKTSLKSPLWLEVLEAAYKLYDAAMNLLWSEDPDTSTSPYYVTAKTGTIEFNRPFASRKVHTVVKYMPGWKDHDLEVHGNCYSFGDIVVELSGFWNGHYHELGQKKLTHNQYYWREAPVTLPNNENLDGYRIAWIEEDWEKWVLWHRSYRPYSGGGCPYIATWNGKEYIPENTILVKSEYLKERKEPNLRDYYLIENPKSIRDGFYSIQLQEFESEITHIDQVKLLVVDHDPDIGIAVTSDGKIVTYRAKMLRSPTRAVDNSGKDVRNIISSLNGLSLKKNTGDWVELDFGKVTGATGNAILLVAPKVKKADSPLLVQVPDGESWKAIAEIYPRSNKYIEAVELKVPQNGLKVRFYWTGYHEVEFVGLAIPGKEGVKISEAPLVNAADSKGQDITKKVLSEDGVYAQLKPGERITLSFKIPRRVAGARDLILVTNGFYTIYPAGFTSDSVGTIDLGDGMLFIPMLLSYDNIKSVKWEFGDGQTSDSFIAFHKYDGGRFYKGSLTVFYKDGSKKVLSFYGG